MQKIIFLVYLNVNNSIVTALINKTMKTKRTCYVSYVLIRFKNKRMYVCITKKIYYDDIK